MTQWLSSSSGGENQLSILGQVTQELKDIEIETPTTLEVILSQKQAGVGDIDVGNQIIKYLRETSSRLNDVTNRVYQQIRNSDQDDYNRGQALKYWKTVYSKI